MTKEEIEADPTRDAQFRAADSDLAAPMFEEFEEPRAKVSSVKAAQLRILHIAAELGIDVSFADIQKFSLLLVAMEQEQAVKTNK